MITSINEYKLYLEKKNSNNIDVFCIDINENDINEDYFKKLNKFLEKKSRTYNIYTNKPNNLTFKKEVKKLKKEDNKKLDIDKVSYFFPINKQKLIYNVLKNIPDDNTIFDTIYTDRFIYLGKQKWLYIEKEFVDLFNKLKKQNRQVCLVGKKSSLNLFYIMLKSFNIKVLFESSLIYDKPMKIKND